MGHQSVLKTSISNSEAEVSLRKVPQGSTSSARDPMHGLVTLTAPLVQVRNVLIPFVNPAFGISMNQDGRFGGTPVVIHDGTDSAAWTATNIVGGKMTDDSTGRPNPPSTKSVKVDNPALNDVWEFDKGSSQALTNYVALSFNINVDKDWTAGDEIQIYGWDGTEVGNRVNLEVYFDESNFDIWMAVIIPLEDMGLTSETITGLRMQLTNKGGGKAPKFYIDDFQLEEDGAPIVFKAATPVKGQRYRTSKIILTLADATATTLNNGTMYALSHDKLLGLSQLANGLLISHVVGGVAVFQAPIRDLADLLVGGFVITNALSDGVNTLITLEVTFTEPLLIVGNVDENHLRIVIRDDLTGLTRFTAAVRGGIELPIL